MTNRSLSLLLSLALAGCAVPTSPSGVTVRGSVIEAATYGLADVSPKVPYELKRLDYIEVWLQNTDNTSDLGSKVSTLNHSGANEDNHTFGNVELSNLTASANYKVTLKAFQVPEGGGTAVEVEETANGASETTFQAPAQGASALTVSPGFKLTLKHQSFSGGGNGAVTFTNGIVTGPDAGNIAMKSAPTFITASSYDFMATCGTDTFLFNTAAKPSPTYQVTGSLPAGVTFNSSTNKIEGTPAADTEGTYNISVKATNASGSVTQTFVLTVKHADPIPAQSLHWTRRTNGLSFPAGLQGFRHGLVLIPVEDERHGGGGITHGQTDGLLSKIAFFRRTPSCTWQVKYSVYLTSVSTDPFELIVGTLALTDTSTWTFTPNSLGLSAVGNMDVTSSF